MHCIIISENPRSSSFVCLRGEFDSFWSLRGDIDTGQCYLFIIYYIDRTHSTHKTKKVIKRIYVEDCVQSTYAFNSVEKSHLHTSK